MSFCVLKLPIQKFLIDYLPVSNVKVPLICHLHTDANAINFLLHLHCSKRILMYLVYYHKEETILVCSMALLMFVYMIKVTILYAYMQLKSKNR